MDEILNKAPKSLKKGKYTVSRFANAITIARKRVTCAANTASTRSTYRVPLFYSWIFCGIESASEAIRKVKIAGLFYVLACVRDFSIKGTFGARRTMVPYRGTKLNKCSTVIVNEPVTRGTIKVQTFFLLFFF